MCTVVRGDKSALMLTCPGAVLGTCSPAGMLWSSTGCRFHYDGVLSDDSVIQYDDDSHVHSQFYVVLYYVLHSIILQSFVLY